MELTFKERPGAFSVEIITVLQGTFADPVKGPLTGTVKEHLDIAGIQPVAPEDNLESDIPGQIIDLFNILNHDTVLHHQRPRRPGFLRSTA